MKIYVRTTGKKIRDIDGKSLKLLQSYDWPGNIRELQHVIERAVVLCESAVLSISASWLPKKAVRAPVGPLNAALVNREKDLIEAALTESHGRVAGPSGAAVKLGLPASTLESRIKVLKIAKNRFRVS